jgi:transposase
LGLVPTKVLMRRFCFSALKKKFNLTALAVDGGDGGGGKSAMIGEKDQGALLGFRPSLDAAQEQIAFAAACQLVEEDDPVALDGAALGDRAALQTHLESVTEKGDRSKQAEAGVPVAELIRQVGISEQTLYRWKKQYKGLETSSCRKRMGD